MNRIVILNIDNKGPLRRADHLSKKSYRLCKKDYETEEEARAQQRAVRAIDEYMKYRICRWWMSIKLGITEI
jgi:hypothetical protein